ncbi:TRAP transporter substrate-binding protein [Pseudomonas mangiferae]|uniref:Twin-arginine translocation signal domain-containing protein n=1 Tax=Pseudomonas mangiferae TaxID=2593654 RepID=A0A553H0B8_9PSED|nr:TRAP transporter substrate-binding protein [Pseudomonas mangiferae]TRX75177.1 twin-arginine translocation signal domain-containing protein [Pseudomonas mangiferae]
MQRRRFLKGAGITAGLATVALPSLAQDTPTVKWRMATNWPKSLDAMFGSADELCQRVSVLTGGKFEIRAFAGGDIVPPAQSLDAVGEGTVECNHVLASAYFGKNTAFAFDTGLPFGMNARQHNAWVQYGGGRALLEKLYGQYNIKPFICGNSAVQMGGWYRKEIKSLDDLKGLKMRVGGVGGMVMQKLGVLPQQIPTSDIYPSLEKGTIDAAEWIGPYDDEKLGLNKIASHYYAPGWWEGSASITSMVNAKAWADLPPLYQAAFECACNEQTLKMLAKYDASNPPALKKLIANGAKVAYFPRDVMDAAWKASNELFAELAGKNPDFKEIWGPWSSFRRDEVSWFRVAESALDNFTASVVGKEA